MWPNRALFNACSQRRIVAFINKEDEDSFENIDESEEDVKIILLDDEIRVYCVLQRLLITPSTTFSFILNRIVFSRQDAQLTTKFAMSS